MTTQPPVTFASVVPSLIRTYVPVAVGALLSWLVTAGVIPTPLGPDAEAGLVTAITAIAIGLYYTAVRKAITAGKLAAVVMKANGQPALLLDQALLQWQQLHGDKAVNADGGLNRATEEALLVQAKRRLAEMDVAEREGALYPGEDVRQVLTDMLTAAKARLRSLRVKLVPRLPGDPLENGRIIDQVVNECLKELADEDPAIFRKGRRRRRTTPAPVGEGT